MTPCDSGANAENLCEGMNHQGLRSFTNGIGDTVQKKRPRSPMLNTQQLYLTVALALTQESV